MDLQLYFRLIWRFRLLMAIGLLLAICFSVLSFARIEFTGGIPSLAYRSGETWSSTSTLLITRHGFPIGRSVNVEPADAAQLAGLAPLYASLVTTDAVHRPPAKSSHEVITAWPVTSPVDNSYVLPLVRIKGTAPAPHRAVEVTQQATAALQNYILQRQRSNGIAASQRVILNQVGQAESNVQLEAGRSKTLPIVIFLTVLTAFFGVSLILENLRPRVALVAPGESAPHEASVARRSA
jgi:hypothetical protein